MIRSTRLLSICFCGFCLAAQVSAQKFIRNIRTAMNAGKLDDAMKLVETCEADSTLEDKFKIYVWGLKVQQRINDAENEKIYLKKECDTLRLFNSTKSIFDYSLKAYEAGVAARKDSLRLKHRLCARLWNYYPNLAIACHYFYEKKDYETALQFVNTYIGTAESPLFVNDPLPLRSQLHLPVLAYLRIKTCFQLERFDEVLNDADLALQDELHLGSTLRYLALASFRAGRMEQYVKFLYQGLREAPGAAFFYSRLSDYYMRSDQLERSMVLTDSLLSVRPSSAVYLFGKSYILMKMKRYEESILVADSVLALDSEWNEAYYNVGACYCNLAAEALRVDPVDVQQYKEKKRRVRTYYEKALPYLETYRERCPDRMRQWGPLLYRVYLNLNMGDAFDEISRMLGGHYGRSPHANGQ